MRVIEDSARQAMFALRYAYLEPSREYLCVQALWYKSSEHSVDRNEKKESVEALHGVFKTASVVVVAQNVGLSVAQFQKLRKDIRMAGGKVQVAKNRLVKIALADTGVADFSALLKGPTMLLWSNDPVAAPKVVSAFAKDNEKFIILGGALGKSVLDVEAVKALATMPSLDELRAKLIGVLVAPATKLAQLVIAPAGKLARVLSAYAEKDKAA